MIIRRLMGRLLSIFLIVGLVTAPMVTPAAAKLLPISQTADMTTMSGAMPCCPDEQKDNDCRDCPLIAMCMLSIARAEPYVTDGIQIFFEPVRLSFSLHDSVADGLVGSPPEHPPRLSI